MGAITAVSRALGMVRVLVVAAVLGPTWLANAFQTANSVSNVCSSCWRRGRCRRCWCPPSWRCWTGATGAARRTWPAGCSAWPWPLSGSCPWSGSWGRRSWPGCSRSACPPTVAWPTCSRPGRLAAVFFVPQVLLYAAGTVATAVLYAKRQFAVTAAAPIGNTVVMVACLIVFRVVAGEDPGLDLSLGERLLLVAAGTGGVVAFVGILLVACERSGFRLRPATPGAMTGWGRCCATRVGAWCSTPGPGCCWERPSWPAPRSRAAWWPTRSAG